MKTVKEIVAFTDNQQVSVTKKDEKLAKNSKVKHVFGIDLGTTNSAISIVKEGKKAEVIKLDSGKYTMPSCVMWKDGKFIVGDYAYQNKAKENVVYSVKRLMQSPSATVTLVDGNNKITMTPAEVSAEILKGLVQQTNGFYGDITDVIVTVPAYFNQIGKDNTRKACELAGFNLIALENEPSAAALLFDIADSEQASEDILIFDLGGGTFDVTMARVSNNSTATSDLDSLYGFNDSPSSSSSGKIIQPLAIGGDGHLGGDDIDEALFKIVCDKADINPKDVSYESHKQCVYRLEQLKKNKVIDVLYQYNFNVELVSGGRVQKQVDITEADFEASLMPTFRKAKEITDNVLAEVPNEVDRIVLVGGSTKSPVLLSLLRKSYPMFTIDNSFNPDLAVTAGAAVKGKILKYGDIDITSFDILPLTIGILEGDSVNPFIEKNTNLPVVDSYHFTTVVDNQTTMRVKLYQGNSVYPEECVELGDLVLTDIKPQPAGKADLVVTVTISADSLMTCKATVDGKAQVLKLSLHGNTNTQSANVSMEEKQILRWRKRARKMGGEDGATLNEMIDNYPASVTREEIIAFMEKHADI